MPSLNYLVRDHLYFLSLLVFFYMLCTMLGMQLFYVQKSEWWAYEYSSLFDCWFGFFFLFIISSVVEV